MKPEDVQSRQDLEVYLRELAAYLDAGATDVENVTTERYLEAASAWIESMPIYFQFWGETMPDEPSWRLVAMMFTAALYYE